MLKIRKIQQWTNCPLSTKRYSVKFPKCETPLSFSASATCNLPDKYRAGHGFETFYMALTKSNSVLLTTKSSVPSMVRVLGLYLSLPIVLDSRFSAYLTTRSQKSYYPAFLHYYITSVTNFVYCDVRNGSLEASTTFTYTPLQLWDMFIKNIKEIKDSNGNVTSYHLTGGLENTPLNDLHRHDIEKVLSMVKILVVALSEGLFPEICEKVLYFYRSIHTAFHPKSRLQMVDDNSFDSRSRHLGMFRFHNYDDNRWIVNGYSLDALSEHGIAMHYSFLGLFCPRITYTCQLMERTLSLDPQPGDKVIDLSDLSLHDFWETIFEGGIPQSKRPFVSTPISSDTIPKGNTGVRSFSTLVNRVSTFSSLYYSKLGETVYYSLERENKVMLHSHSYIYR